jgi:aspartyl/asparaginyl beta-hydroxylase (cupin superfamily)
MTPEVKKAFDAIKREFGAASIERVELMTNPRHQDRDPLQAGAKYVMPGISRKPWHDPYEHASLLPIVRELEAKHAGIKQEYSDVWRQRATALQNYEHYLMSRDDWKALYIYRNGALTADSAKVTPVTHAVLRDFAVKSGAICPLLESHFSTLHAGATIPPHCDLWNFSINLHLAVDVPSGCAIRVANVERTWQEGKCLLFDYSYQHEAWNKGDRPRTCLLVDLWHPEVTAPERKALVVLITEIRKLMAGPATQPVPQRPKWSPWRVLAGLRKA